MHGLVKALAMGSVTIVAACDHVCATAPDSVQRPFYPDQHPNNYAVVTPGRGAGGKALRLVYEQGGGERFIWKTDPEDNRRWYAPPSAAFVVQYWFRISKNGGPGGSPGYGNTAVGMK